MPASVTTIDAPRSAGSLRRRGHWCLLEVAQAGAQPVPLGILLVDQETDRLSLRMRGAADLEGFTESILEEDEEDVLDFLAEDLQKKASEQGGRALLDTLEDSLSHFLRIGDRAAIAWTGDAQRAADRLYDEYVDAEIQPFVRHLPLYTLRAAATRFGEGMESEQDGWVRVPGRLRLTPDMFVARVVGRSMEPLIPDASLCVFRQVWWAAARGSASDREVRRKRFLQPLHGQGYTASARPPPRAKRLHGSTGAFSSNP